MGWTVLTGDGAVVKSAAWLHGLVLLVSTTGGDVTVYAGQDTSGQKIGRFEAIADQSTPVMFNPSIECDSGIYVDVGSNVTEILILWSPKC